MPLPLLTICNIFWNSSQPSFSGTSSCSSPSSGWVAHCSYQDSVVIFVGSSSWVTKQLKSTHTHQPGGSRAACDTSDLYERYVDAMFRQCSLPLCRLMRNEAQNQMTHVPRCLTDIDIRFDWLRTPVTHQTPSQLQAIIIIAFVCDWNQFMSILMSDVSSSNSSCVYASAYASMYLSVTVSLSPECRCIW